MSQQSHSWVRSLQERFARPRSRQRWSRQPNVIDTRTGERAWCTLAGTHRSAFGGSGTVARHNRARPEDVALGEGRRTQKHREPLGGAGRAIQLEETGRGSRAQARAGGERGQCSARRFGLGKRRRVPVAVAAARRRDVLRAAERALRTARHLSCQVCFNTTKRSNLLDQKTC